MIPAYKPTLENLLETSGATQKALNTRTTNQYDQFMFISGNTALQANPTRKFLFFLRSQVGNTHQKPDDFCGHFSIAGIFFYFASRKKYCQACVLQYLRQQLELTRLLLLLKK